MPGLLNIGEAFVPKEFIFHNLVYIIYQVSFLKIHARRKLEKKKT